MTEDGQIQIDRFIARHGVTRCPPGIAMGVTALERKLGATATPLFGQLAARAGSRTKHRGKDRPVAAAKPGDDFWDLGRRAAFEARWREGMDLGAMAVLFALSSADGVRAAARDFGLCDLDRARPGNADGGVR